MREKPTRNLLNKELETVGSSTLSKKPLRKNKTFDQIERENHWHTRVPSIPPHRLLEILELNSVPESILGSHLAEKIQATSASAKLNWAVEFFT